MKDYNINEIRARIEKGIEDNKTAIEEAEAAAKAAAAEAEAATKKMEAALHDADPKEYSQAKRQLQESRDAIEMYTARADRLRRGACFTEDEAKELQREILDGLKAKNEACEKKLAAMLSKLLPIVDEMCDEIAQGNATLDILQRRGMKHVNNIVSKKDERGQTLNFVSPYNGRFTKFGVAELGRWVRNNYIYKKSQEGKGTEA